MKATVCYSAAWLFVAASVEVCLADDQPQPVAVPAIVAKPGLFKSLTEPPCSYCSTQNRKQFIRPDDRVCAWIRGAHNGGAVPLRHFLSSTRVINDTYGLFFYDPDGGYVAAYQKDYGYEFHGWRQGVMVVKGRDGTLWSALSGRAIDGPQAGKRLTRIPHIMTAWSLWLMLHPESTAYDLFDGKKYEVQELPIELSRDVQQALDQFAVDPRRPPLSIVHGVEVGGAVKAFPLHDAVERACFVDQVGGEPIAVFWYGPTKSSVAFRRRLEDQTLTFFADDISPETAPFKDKETGSRWTLAGRCVDGQLKGRELTWISGVQCRWYAWSAEFPKTDVFGAK